MGARVRLLVWTLPVMLAVFARFSFAALAPPSVNWDEAAFGYNAYSLLLTGRDEYGYKLPLVFRSFDEYKPPLYVYLSVPFIKFMGLNEASARMVSKISGVLNVMLIMIIASLLTRNRKVGLASGFLAAIEPWTLIFSRPARPRDKASITTGLRLRRA